MLVDTCATLPVVPQPAAQRLDLVARRSQPVILARGQRDVWLVAEVRLARDGRAHTRWSRKLPEPE